MKTINLELSEDSAREMLPILERKRGELDKQLIAVTDQIRKIKVALNMVAPPRPSVLPPPTPLYVIKSGEKASIPTVGGFKTPTGRIKKGQSEQMIVDYLKTVNEGTTIKEITAATGTVYGTARRVLDNLRKQKIANEDGGTWKLGQSEFE